MNKGDMGEKTKRRIPLARENFLCVKSLMEEVYLPEIGGSVWVKAISTKEHRQYRTILMNDKELDGDGNAVSTISALIALSVVDEKGRYLFTIEDREVIDDLPNVVIMRLFGISARINGLTERAVEEREKN